MPLQRQDNFESIRRDGDFDVLIVGGGINGLGVFRELSLQGVRVLLVERCDFCSGCSAAPSRMIHGGLRYLENGEFNLVRESLAERDALLLNAPHMVRPLPTTIPLATRMSGLFNAATSFLGLSDKPAQRGALPVKIGLALYDLVTRKRRQLPPHRFRSARETKEKWPELTSNLRYSATYYDAWISHPERLGIELISDTIEMAPQSIALNYVEVRRDADGYVLHDRESGADLPINPRVIVNASGAWLDDVRRNLTGGAPDDAPLISGTKGSHLILDTPNLHDALDGHMMFFENTDGRVCIVFPYLGKVLAGSTDIRVETVTRTRCEDDERDYILGSLRLIFPDLNISENDIVFSYSGIRPLPSSDHNFTGRISRSHFTHRLDGPVPQICMVGGKWTTFRAFAEQTADKVLTELGHARTCDTHQLAIGGGKDFPEHVKTLIEGLSRDLGISSERAAYLVDAYGTQAATVWRDCRARGQDTPVVAGCSLTCAEVVRMVTHEQARHPADILLRRTNLAITGQVSAEMIATIANVMAQELGWTTEQTDAEIAAFTDELSRYHGVSATTLNQRSLKRNTECA
jgi:glycerol-3-phosphate dehydrogenase